jgi:hypothetical protein
MLTLEKQFIKDSSGEDIGVILPINEYSKLLEQLEDLEDVIAYDRAKESGEESIPWEQAIKEIEEQRNDL